MVVPVVHSGAVDSETTSTEAERKEPDPLWGVHLDQDSCSGIPWLSVQG